MSSNEDYVRSEGLRLLSAGSRLLGQSALSTSIEGPSRNAGEQIRQAHSVLRSAMNWLEDTEDFETAHARLDAAGRLARTNYPRGCELAMRDGSYFQECPVASAHNRVGMSPGYVVRAAHCSVCDRAFDDDECTHVRGRTYDGVRCVRVITDVDLLEVSYVARPASPDARITSISVSKSEIREKLGRSFVAGMPVVCDRCLEPCSGVSRPFESSPTVIA